MLNTFDNGCGPELKWVVVTEVDSIVEASCTDPKKATPFMFHKVDGKPDVYTLKNMQPESKYVG